jgi:hypothetical protein
VPWFAPWAAKSLAAAKVPGSTSSAKNGDASADYGIAIDASLAPGSRAMKSAQMAAAGTITLHSDPSTDLPDLLSYTEGALKSSCIAAPLRM